MVDWLRSLDNITTKKLPNNKSKIKDNLYSVLKGYTNVMALIDNIVLARAGLFPPVLSRTASLNVCHDGSPYLTTLYAFFSQ